MVPAVTTAVASVGPLLASAGSYAPALGQRTGVTIVSPTRRLFIKFTRTNAAPATLSSTDYQGIIEANEHPFLIPLSAPYYIWMVADGGTATDVQVTEWIL